MVNEILIIIKKFIKFNLFFLLLLFFLPGRVKGTDKIKVYFNKSVDHSVSSGGEAMGNVALDSLLCSFIHNAQYSIDCCIYSFSNPDWEVKDSLVAAYYRGVNIRFIYDDDHMNSVIQYLINAGIPVINDNFPPGYDGHYNMHNKFFIFDYRDSSSYTDDWVWTGSYNVTNWGTVANAQNVVTIQDHEVSEAYTNEFEEMWGSSTDTPDSGTSKFSSYKTDNTQHLFTVDGIPIEVYFGPSDEIKDNMVNKISTVDYEAYFCIFYFSHQDISNALKGVWNGMGGSDLSNIRGVFDSGCWLSNSGSEARDMAGIPGSGNPWSPPLDTTSVILVDNVSNNGLLHHKYMLIDAEHPESDPWVLTGSTNWSYWGDNNNDENSIFIQSSDISNLYFQEWMARYTESGGEFSGINLDEQKEESRMELSTRIIVNSTTITLYTKNALTCPTVNVFNIGGQKVATLGLNRDGDGLYTTVWAGEGDKGSLPKGIYFLTVEGSRIANKKVLLIR